MKNRFAAILCFILILPGSFYSFGQLNAEHDSILNLFSHVENQRHKLDSLQNFIGKNRFKIKSNPIPLVEYLMKEARRIEYDQIYTDFLSQKALFISERNQDYRTSEQLFKRELELKKQYGSDSSRLSVAYYNVGTSIMQQGRFKDGIPYITKALEIAEAVGESMRITYACNALAMSYSSLGQDSLAMEYYDRSYQVALEGKHYREAIYALQNMVFTYIAREQNNKALEQVQKIDAIIPQIEDEGLKMQTEFTRASLNLKLGKQEEALAQFEELEEYFKKTDRRSNLASLYFNRGKALSDMGKYREAITEFNKSLEHYRQLGKLHEVMRIFYELTYNYQLLEDVENAFANLEKYFTLRDSIMNSESQGKIAAALQQFEAEKKQRQIEQLEQNELLQQAEIEKQKNIRNFSLVVLGLVVLLAFIIIRNYRQKIQAQKKITEQEEEIDHQSQMLEATEEERKRIAKELHDGIGGTLAGVKLKLVKLAEENKEAQKLAKQVGDACDELRSISHNLTPPKLFNASFTQVVRNFMQNASENTSIEFGFNYSQEEAINQLPEEKKTHLYRIIQELVNNAVKHSGAVFADVDLNVRDGNLNFIYTDDGFGFDADTKHLEGGIGLGGIQTRVKLMKGIFNIVTKPGMGTAIDIQIPAKDEKHQHINS